MLTGEPNAVTVVGPESSRLLVEVVVIWAVPGAPPVVTSTV
jgi:hypothetical protein